MPTLKVLGAVSGVSAQPPACAFGLLRGHFGCPAWAFSGASYYRTIAHNGPQIVKISIFRFSVSGHFFISQALLMTMNFKAAQLRTIEQKPFQVFPESAFPCNFVIFCTAGIFEPGTILVI